MTRLRAVLLVLLLALLTACGQDGTGTKGYISGSGVITRLDPAERKTPAEVTGETLEGEQWSLADQQGEVVVLNVWGSWCPPCRAEAPALVEAAERLPDVQFMGVNVREKSIEDAQGFERTYDVPYPSLYDPAGRTLLAFRGTLPPNAIPSTVIVDADGKVAALILGEVPSAGTLVALIQDVAGA